MPMNAGPRDGGYNNDRGSAGYNNQRGVGGGYNEGGPSYNNNNDRAPVLGGGRGGGGGGYTNDGARGSYMDDRGAPATGGGYNTRDVGYNDGDGYGKDFQQGRVVDRGYDDRIRSNDGSRHSGAGGTSGGGYNSEPPRRYAGAGAGTGTARDFDRQDDRGFDRDRQYDDVPPRRDYDSRGFGGAALPKRDYDSRGAGMPPQRAYDSRGAGMPPQRAHDSRSGGMPPQRDFDSRSGGMPPQRDFDSRSGGMPPQRDFDWVNLPREIPLPAVFMGVDVFHSPRTYSVEMGKRVTRASVAAVVVQVIRSHDERDNTHTDIFSQTFRREGGQEMGLGDSIHTCVANALRIFDVNPMSCVVWRDGVGVGDPAIKQVMAEEIPSIRKALTRGNGQSEPVPLSYLVVQKRISTKFLSVDGSSAVPLGALVTTLQGLQYSTFYINGTSPSYSTPKPARFIIAKIDDDLPLSKQKIAELSWAFCHDYSNWTGAIKLPSPVQCSHKLAELAGQMKDGGEEIAHEKFAGKAYFL